MTKRMILMLLAAGIVFGGIFGFKAYKGYMMGKFMASRGVPPQTVSTTKAGYQAWQPKLEAVGSLRAVRGTDLSPELPGIVSAIHFKQGDEVKKGALLLELDATSDIAKWQSLKAVADLAQTTYKRDKAQFKVKAVSQQTLDTDAGNLKEAQANVAEQQALIEKKLIRAPFAGRLGIRAVDLGQYLKAGDTIVTLQQLDPIYVDFHLPQQSLSAIHVGQEVTAKTDAYPGKVFTGRIEVINPQVDTSTRNVKIRAKLDNPDHTLLPGMYATVDVIAGAPMRYITLPQSAITYNPYGNIVYLVAKKGSQLTAKQVFVTTGATRGDQVAILKGVKQGDTVVTSGQIKLRNGSPIVVNNSIQPTDNPNPKPKDE
jgi:membrane fusion protein (multidrug efflux system)